MAAVVPGGRTGERAGGRTTRRAAMGALAGGAVAVGAAAALAACSPGEAGRAEGDAARKAALAKASGEFVFIAHQEIEAYRKWITPFMEQRFPNVRLQIDITPGLEPYFTKFVALMASGQSVEFMLNHESRAQAMAFRGALLPLDQYRARAPFLVPESELFTAPVATTLSWKGKLYAWPNLVANNSIYLNKTLFERAKVPLPEENWTWNDLAQAAQRLTLSAGGQPESIGWPEWQDPSWPPGWYPLLRAYGGDHFDKDQTRCLLDQAGGVACLQVMADLWCARRAAPDPDTLTSLGGTNGVFEGGQGALRMGGAAYYRTLVAKSQGLFDWGIAHMPLGPAGRFIRAGGSSWSIPKSSRLPDVAWEFLRFQVSDVTTAREIAEEQGSSVAHLPTYERFLAPGGDLAQSVGPIWRKVFVDDIVKHGVSPQYSPVGDQYAPLLGEEVGALARCGRSPREAAGNIVARANRMLAEAR
jgi:ABC-type glycerol-3-phosphate transport system substrate-binding protein